MRNFIKNESVFILGVALLTLLIVGNSYAAQGGLPDASPGAHPPTTSTVTTQTSAVEITSAPPQTVTSPSTAQTPSPTPKPAPHVVRPEREYDDDDE